MTSNSLPDKTQEELEELIVNYRVKCDVAWNKYRDKIYTLEDYHKAIEWELNKLTTYINKYYVPREEVEKIIGEDDNIYAIPVVAKARNDLRAEQRAKLKSIRREKR